MQPSNENVLSMVNISKSFAGVDALSDVSFDLKKSEVMALIGENGAGKSTLMKILSGIFRPDTGTIMLKGKEIDIDNPRDALMNGISMIHQELTPILEMTVAENIFIGREICFKHTNIINKRAMNARTKQLLKDLKIGMNPKAKMSTLSVAQIQIIEIIKAVSYNADIIIMDEPTSAISNEEVSKLFGIISKLIKNGHSVIYISHKMDEITRIAHTVTILRDGRLVDTRPIEGVKKTTLMSLMVGRELSSIYPKEECKIGDRILEVKELCLKKKVKNIGFNLRQGEILGITGLTGAGRTELVEAIFGLRKISSGEVLIKGKRIRVNHPKDAILNKIAFVPEDRKLLGLNLKGSVKNNITIANLKEYCALKQIVIPAKEKVVADKQMKLLRIKTPGMHTIVNSLSGGNQQKVVIAKCLLCNPDIMIFDEPTRGIDVGAKTEIYKIMSALLKQGKAIIMISSEMPETLGMSDRILVLHDGKQTGEFSRSEFNQEKLLACALGNLKGEMI